MGLMGRRDVFGQSELQKRLESVLAADKALGLKDLAVNGDNGKPALVADFSINVVRDLAIEVHRATGRQAGEYRGAASVEVDREDLGSGNRITMANRYGDAMAIYPHIARALRGEEPYAVSLDSALDLTRVLDAIRRSAGTGAALRMEDT